MKWQLSFTEICCILTGLHTNMCPFCLVMLEEFNMAMMERKYGVVLAKSDIIRWLPLGSPLADYDTAGFARLAMKQFDT